MQSQFCVFRESSKNRIMRSLSLLRTIAPKTIVRTNVYVTRGSIELTIREANKTVDKYRLKDTSDVINSQKLAMVEACGKTDMAIEFINGIPEEQMKDRRVRVYKPSRNPMQSGVQNMKEWRIEFNLKEKWENPTMGWGSTADPLSNVAGWMKFKHKDDAIAFCHRQGWRVTEVNDANEKTVPQRNYGDNYEWSSRKRTATK